MHLVDLTWVQQQYGSDDDDEPGVGIHFIALCEAALLRDALEIEVADGHLLGTGAEACLAVAVAGAGAEACLALVIGSCEGWGKGQDRVTM